MVNWQSMAGFGEVFTDLQISGEWRQLGAFGAISANIETFITSL
jgi:hypothetical protein